MFQAPSWLLTLNTPPNARKWSAFQINAVKKPCALSTRGGVPTKMLGWRRMPEALHRVDRTLLIVLGKLFKLSFKADHWWLAKHNCRFTRICAGRVWLAPRMFSYTWTAYELNDRSAVHCDSQTVLLPCRLDLFVKSSGEGPHSNSLLWFGQPSIINPREDVLILLGIRWFGDEEQ